MKTITLWDAPLRIFHWSLLLAVVGAVATGLEGGNWMEWHGRFGVAIAALLGFRLCWGVIGATHARFLNFVRGPMAIRDYLKGQWHGVGHNPLGALSVLGLLGVLVLQLSSGLLANDDIAFAGPYNGLVSKSTEILAVWIHKNNAWLLGALIGTHLAAIAFYRWIKKDDLISPMISGKKRVPETTPDPKPGQPAALIVALAVAALAGWLAAGGIAEMLAPPPPPPIETPNW